MKKYITLLLLVAVGFTSCTDFLMEENKTQYSQDYIFNSEGGLDLAVSALYVLHRNYLGADAENNTHWAVERGTDVVMTNGGSGNFYGIYFKSLLLKCFLKLDNITFNRFFCKLIFSYKACFHGTVLFGGNRKVYSA